VTGRPAGRLAGWVIILAVLCPFPSLSSVSTLFHSLLFLMTLIVLLLVLKIDGMMAETELTIEMTKLKEKPSPSEHRHRHRHHQIKIRTY